jgi:hypothetical protein
LFFRDAFIHLFRFFLPPLLLALIGVSSSAILNTTLVIQIFMYSANTKKFLETEAAKAEAQAATEAKAKAHTTASTPAPIDTTTSSGSGSESDPATPSSPTSDSKPKSRRPKKD